jgi:hypothetical protein
MRSPRLVPLSLLAAVTLTASLTVLPAPASAAITAACGSTASGQPGIIYNPCADLDLTSIEECRSGTCYSFCWTRWTQVFCEPKFQFINVREWLKYKTGTKPPRGCHTS